jgi:DNA invertase Pin-like site-specific DNA recombinase
MRGPLERFTSLLVAALLRLGVEPQEAVRLGRGAALLVAQHAAGVRWSLSPARRRDAQQANRAARLRAEGKSFSAIARELKCSEATAWRLARAGASFAAPATGETGAALASGEPTDLAAQGCN